MNYPLWFKTFATVVRTVLAILFFGGIGLLNFIIFVFEVRYPSIGLSVSTAGAVILVAAAINLWACYKIKSKICKCFEEIKSIWKQSKDKQATPSP